MDFESACKWSDAADVLESQEILSRFKVSDWPNLKKNDREKLFKQLHKRAYPFEWTNAKPLSVEEAAKRLSGLSFPKGKGK